MLARCTACQQTFRTETFGRQKCPSCGAEVELREPTVPAVPAPETAAAGAPTPPASDLGELTPWERRAELGFWPALGKTVSQALFEPTRFFSSMRYDQAEGAHLYFFMVAVVPQLVALLLGQLLSNSAEEVDKTLDLLKQFGQVDPKMLEQIKSIARLAGGPGALVGELLMVPVVAFAQLYLLAGLSHLTLVLLGKAKGGWTATFKTFVYAYSAGVVGLIPSCGSLIVLMWASALEMVGLAKGHRTTAGYGVAAVLSWHALFWCCCFFPPVIFGLVLLSRTLGGH